MSEWQPIETAPMDGTSIIGLYWDVPWSESHLKGRIEKCWFQTEFDGFISRVSLMTLAPGITFEDGKSEHLHHPEFAPVSHWMPFPEPPK